MKTRPCTYCGEHIGMIQTLNGKYAPIEAHVIKRMGSAPLAEGKYYSEVGELFDERSVPNGITVYLSHLPICPGAMKERKL